jgi:hypothetical protein
MSVVQGRGIEVRQFPDSRPLVVYHDPDWQGEWGVWERSCVVCGRSFGIVHPHKEEGVPPTPCPYVGCGGISLPPTTD